MRIAVVVGVVVPVLVDSVVTVAVVVPVPAGSFVALVVAEAVVVVGATVLGMAWKSSPSHDSPSGHTPHLASPGGAGKNHFSPVYSSPFSCSTSSVHVQGVSAAFFKL